MVFSENLSQANVKLVSTLCRVNFQNDTLKAYDSKPKDDSEWDIKASHTHGKSEQFSKRQANGTHNIITERFKQRKTMYWLLKEELPKHKFDTLVEFQVNFVVKGYAKLLVSCVTRRSDNLYQINVNDMPLKGLMMT